MTKPRAWKSEAGTIRVLPGRCRLLDMTIGGHSALNSSSHGHREHLRLIAPFFEFPPKP